MASILCFDQTHQTMQHRSVKLELSIVKPGCSRNLPGFEQYIEPGLVQVWLRFGAGLFRFGSGVVQVCFRVGSGLVHVWFSFG